MKTVPPGYLYTHARNNARTVARRQIHKHTRYIHQSIYPIHTRTDSDLNMRTHSHSKRI